MADQTNLLSFSTRVDLSGAKAGMAELKDTISTQMAEAASAVSDAGEMISATFTSMAEASATASETMAEAYSQMEGQGIETLAALNAATAEATEATVEGAQESAAAVSDSVDIQQAAYMQLAAATLENSVAQQLLRGAYQQAASGAMDASVAIEALAGFESIAAEASAALAGAKANLAEVTEYLNAETVVEMSTTEAATAAQNGMASAMERTAAASGHTVSEVQAASGAIRVLEGALPIRAVERFAVTSLGLGPILQAAFPIVGAVAFGEVMVETYDKSTKAIQAVEQAGTRSTAAWKAENDALQVANDNLDITNDKLQNTLDKLEHKPENGMALALDEARQSADQLAVSLQKDIDKSNELITKNKVGALGELMGKQGTDDSAKMVTDTNSKIAAVKNSYQATIDDASDRGASQQNIVDIKTAEMTHLEDVYSTAEARIKPILHAMQQDMEMYQESGGGRGKEQSGNIAILQGYLQQLQEEQRAIGNSFREDTLKEQIAPLQADKANAGGNDKAAEAKLRAMQNERNQQEQEYGKNVKADHDYWTARIGQFETDGKQYTTVNDKITADDLEGARTANAAITKEREAMAKGVSDTAAVAGMQRIAAEASKAAENVSQTGDRWNEYHEQVTKAGEIQASVAEDMAKANLAVIEQEGGISKLGAAHVTAGIHADEYRLKLVALEAQLAKLKDEAVIDPLTGANLDPKNAAAQQSTQNQISKTQGQQSVTGVQDKAATATAISAPYMTAFNTINEGFLSVQQKMIMGTQSISRDFAQMGAQLVVSVASAFEKMLLHSVEFEIQSTVAHQASNTAKVTSDATAAAASTGISATSSLAQVAHSAAVAAAGAWASLSTIPIVGPVLGAVAAGATYAGVMALAAFDTGGIIANTGVALVHKDEAVLPAPLTNLLMTTANTGSGGGNNSSSSMTQNNHFSGNTDAHFRSQMMRNSKTAMKTVQRQVRSSGRA
jgi:hypothetical protein